MILTVEVEMAAVLVGADGDGGVSAVGVQVFFAVWLSHGTRGSGRRLHRSG
ncbi:hypothetical protein [Streptomyces albipurpureus]|uniref:Uncharacterized protein n=1 Tax=Streptomyces albipurpureus TaxID=2897419 RepID=A0ABT0UI17_9ACTN|nr:hypothetical protein [Streptomyces sp. CWNU-1]MCM2387098.1 hypothetical protein [Streptomyces sp. CWNU-1]